MWDFVGHLSTVGVCRHTLLKISYEISRKSARWNSRVSMRADGRFSQLPRQRARARPFFCLIGSQLIDSHSCILTSQLPRFVLTVFGQVFKLICLNILCNHSGPRRATIMTRHIHIQGDSGLRIRPGIRLLPHIFAVFLILWKAS